MSTEKREGRGGGICTTVGSFLDSHIISVGAQSKTLNGDCQILDRGK